LDTTTAREIFSLFHEIVEGESRARPAGGRICEWDLVIRPGLKTIFPEQMIFDLIRDAAIGAWASLGAPCVFVKMRLAESSTWRTANIR